MPTSEGTWGQLGRWVLSETGAAHSVGEGHQIVGRRAGLGLVDRQPDDFPAAGHRERRRVGTTQVVAAGFRAQG